MDIKKLNITILGSSGAIGSSLAKKYLNDGNHLNLFYRSIKKKNLLKKKLNYVNNKKKIQFHKFSFSNEENISKSIQKNKKTFLNTDLLILTVAEQGQISNFFEMNLEQFKKTFFINFIFYIVFFRKLAPILRKKKKMLVILFSGGGSTSYRKNFSIYSLTKLGLVKLTEILSNEILNKNIRFNILSPGIIKSNMTKKILHSKKKVSSNELNKILKNLNYTDDNIIKIYKTINFLNSKKGKLISGKFISSSWDAIYDMKQKKLNQLLKSDYYTLRRKEFI